MAAASCTDEEFLSLIQKHGVTATSRVLHITTRNTFKRKKNIEAKLGVRLCRAENYQPIIEYPHRATLQIENGVVLVGSDAHYWPGPASTIHRAIVAFAKEYKPRAFILNGDALDAARISRHPPIGWETRPTLIEEIESAKDRLHEIETAVPRGCRRIWNLGNHDARFETRLATVAPEYAKIAGVHLKDHFPLWEPAWSTFINDSFVAKHRLKGGIHAPHNNTMWAGRTMVTGHLHSAKVIPFTDYNGTRFGVDTGCISETDGRQFTDYTEDAPKNWVSAFGFFTFKDGRLLWPELVVKYDDKHVQFRGQLIKV